MNNPVFQHYIPRSYLKNFALEKGKKRFVVDTLMRGKDEKIKVLPTKAICAEKNIYTFDNSQPGDAYALEKFYAKEVDAVYPQVYNTLVNSDVMNIASGTKREILNTLLSLKFRRPEPLQAVIDKLETMFEGMAAHKMDPESSINYHIDGSDYFFKYKDLMSELDTRRKALKETWLIKHFAQWQEFVDYKMECGLDVIEVPSVIPIITSDNPISIYDMKGRLNLRDPLHPFNMLEIPLDRTHYLVIHPNATSDGTYNRIHRSKRDKFFAAGVNIKVEENSHRRIIAYPGDLQSHFESQNSLNSVNKESVNALTDIIDKTTQMTDLWALIKKKGDSIFNQEVADKVREMRKTGVMKGDQLFENIILELAKKGFLTV